MSIRLYENFIKKAKPQILKKERKEEEICITIPLKGGRSKEMNLNEDFVKVIEHEYAVRYLEQMGVDPTDKMIARVLKNQSLST